MTPALILALTLMAAAPPADDSAGEPLPPGAPTRSYELAAWCYGALGEYLQIYEKVKPDLRDIDHMFGTSVVEDQPYQSDMAAAHVELKLIGDAVGEAEKASDHPISQQGVAAMHQGQMIWSVVEAKTRRELARAWLGWALPDRCDSNARELATRSIVLGRALKYNAGDNAKPPPSTPELFAPLPDHDSGPAKPSQAAIARPALAPPPAQAAASAPIVASQPPVGPAPAPSGPVPPAALVATQPPPEAAAPSPTAVVVEASSPKPATAPIPTPTAVAASPPTIAPPNPDQAQEPTL